MQKSVTAKLLLGSYTFLIYIFFIFLHHKTTNNFSLFISKHFSQWHVFTCAVNDPKLIFSKRMEKSQTAFEAVLVFIPEAYHLRREETDWFDKPRDGRSENGQEKRQVIEENTCTHTHTVVKCSKYVV